MANFAYIYSDPSSFTAGETPYGTYDTDSTFQTDIVNATKWVARRLGHPVMQLEIYSGSIYACFEEAISEYSTHINNFNIRNWMWNSYASENRQSGSALGSTGSLEPQSPHMGSAVFLSKQYGEAANVGGDIELKSGSISLVKNQQQYNLQDWATVSESSKRIEIQRVFNYGPAAMTKFYDPYAGSFDQRTMLDSFGMGSTSPAVSFLLRPISYDITRAMAIENTDKIRKSNYSFHIANNKIRIFPRPDSAAAGDKIWFEYYVRDDRTATTRTWTNSKVSDPSNVPYKFITYAEINAPGRQWIRKYALALSKELLGIIRSKYASMPIPDGEVTLDGDALKAEGREEKQMLLEELKEFLETITLTEKTKAEAEEAEANRQVLSHSPLEIFIG